jgi:hypothetical protein
MFNNKTHESLIIAKALSLGDGIHRHLKPHASVEVRNTKLASKSVLDQ